MITLPYLTIGTELVDAGTPTPGGGGYLQRRRRWLYACGIVLLLVLL